MDYNYNRIVLEQYLDKLFKYVLEKYGEIELKKLFNDLIAGKESNILNKNIQNELNKYSKDTIRLILEKNVLFSLENSVVNIKKTYWKVLKDRAPRINGILLSHYYEKYIDLLKNKKTIYKSETIEELNNNYNNEITKSMMLNKSFDEIINNTSSFSLNHMENLNANGRTININGKRKGGIFLSKESIIGYGNFINKDDFLKKINDTKIYKVTDKGTISNEDLKEIVNNIEQKINISNNSKNNAKSIFDTKSNRKAGNLFLGKDGIDLPNGEYVSVEELSFAIKKFVMDRNRKEQKKKIIKIKGMLKASIAAASLAVSLLTSTLSVNSKENTHSNTIQYEVDDLYSQNDQKLSNEVVADEINSINSLDNLKSENQSEINSDKFYVEENSVDNNEIEVENSSFDSELSETNNELLESDNNIALNEFNDNIEISAQDNFNEEISDNSNDTINDNKDEIIEKMDDIEPEKTNEINNLEEENNEIVESFEEDELIKQNDSSEQTNVGLNNEENSIQEISNDFSIDNESTEINGQDIVDYAVQFVGNPYVYGGTNLTEGTDCSGFTQSVYSNFGINIARDSNSQIKSGTNIGTNIEEAMPGDLLCFNGHVGIYIGDGQMVHAANAKRGIVINDVDYDKGKTLKAIVRPNGISQTSTKTR